MKAFRPLRRAECPFFSLVSPTASKSLEARYKSFWFGQEQYFLLHT